MCCAKQFLDFKLQPGQGEEKKKLIGEPEEEEKQFLT